VASFADCTAFSKPAYEDVFCQNEPVGERLPVNELLWSAALSPFARVDPPRGVTADEAAGDFARRAIRAQPLDYAGAVAADALRMFAPSRGTLPGEFGDPPWEFHRRYPVFFRGSVCSPAMFREIREEIPAVADAVVQDRTLGCAAKTRRMKRVLAERGGKAHVESPLASFLVRYQTFAYAPGPLLALALVLPLAVALGLGRPRVPRQRWAGFFFAAAAIAACVASVFVTVPSWRYQIPQLALLPPALALALSALTLRDRRLTASLRESFGTIARRSRGADFQGK
jgi:hypothetical protein